jgi:energy-coupling factor transporter ATP-binding protein EcfA2
MVDTSEKLNKIMKMVEKGEYFVINRPRQYGKTTTLVLLRKILLKTNEYLPINLNFASIGAEIFETRERFCSEFLRLIANDMQVVDNSFSKLFSEKAHQAIDFGSLSDTLTEILSQIPKKIVIMIDEVDKSGDNDLFIHFLQMLRDKYISADMGVGVTFQSVILAGVHDVKTLKLKIRPESEARLNSPWNIAADFKIDMSFSPEEIATMLTEYVNETGNKMNIKAISERIYYWTSGYPLLVSKIYKTIDEDIKPTDENKEWVITDVEQAVMMITDEKNTLFEDLIINLK